jgi:hypothetical protein
MIVASQLHAQDFLVNSHYLRLYCSGQGLGPAIVLESGFGMKLEYWQQTQIEVAKFAKICSYDRADTQAEGRTPDVIDDLHTLLAHGASVLNL